jgi:hypothetical protein
MLVWEPGKKVPIYAFPRQDVTPGTGPAAPAASQARGFADPGLDGYITIPWDSLDHWFEEDEEVFVHPRDPFVRIPAFGPLSSVIFLGEDPTRTGIIGACLIGGSVICFTICDSRDSQANLSPADGPNRQIHGAYAPGAENPPAAAGEPAR